MTTPTSLEALRIRNFRTLWTASMFANVGGFLQAVAAAWLMLELTGSALWVGLMAASPTLPLLVLALPAGAVADLVDRRRILVSSQVLMSVAALGMAALSLTGLVTPGGLLGLGLLLGVGLAFNLPAWQAMVPDLVPRSLVPGAVALNSASFNVARAIGPMLGGAIVATAGPAAAFLINALSYLAIVAVVARFKGGRWHGDQESSVANAIAVGVRYARFTAPFRWLLLVAALFALTSAVLQSMLPVFTEQVLGEDEVVYGFLLGAMGVGALVGAFTIHWARRLMGSHLVPASIAAFGVAGVAAGMSRHPAATALAMLVAGIVWVWNLSTLNATAQLMSPAWVRGRVMSLYTLAFVGFLPLGAVLAGSLADLAGVASAVVALSVGSLVLGLAGFRWPIPVLDRVQIPESPLDWDPAPHETAVMGSPVMVANSFRIDEGDLSDFLATMNELRLVRLRTGAYRWRLYREAGDPHRMTEIFLLRSWEDHLRQHGRLDVAGVETIRRARSFDRADGPVSRHWVAIDVADPHGRPGWDELLARHDDLHRADGSIPLEWRTGSPPRVS